MRFLLTSALALSLCLVAGARATTTYCFDFEGACLGAEDNEVATYMEGIYGSDITVQNGHIGTDLRLAGYGQFIRSDDPLAGGDNYFRIRFEEVQISAVKFDWLTISDEFWVEAYAANGDQVYSQMLGGSDAVYVWPWQWDQNCHGGEACIEFDQCVTELYIHDSSFGFVAIDNLCVEVCEVIPAPGAIVLGSLGVGLVGFLRRRRILS